jgi:hypothetical protein
MPGSFDLDPLEDPTGVLERSWIDRVFLCCRYGVVAGMVWVISKIFARIDRRKQAFLENEVG